MKKITALGAILAIFLVFLPSCMKKSDPLSYENGKINAEIVISMNGTSVGAEMELMPQKDGALRDARLDFISPDSMKGISVQRIDGETRAILGELELTGKDVEALLRATELFSTGGSIVSAETDRLDGESVTRLSARGESGSFTVWLTRDGLPRRIEAEGMTVDVVWIEAE